MQERSLPALWKFSPLPSAAEMQIAESGSGCTGKGQYRPDLQWC